MKLIISFLFACLSIGSIATAQQNKKTETKSANHLEAPMTSEQRQKMAEMHDKMATCLRSEKPMSDCKTEMMQNCKAMMGKGECPMTGHMGQGMMMDHGKMMHGHQSGDEN
ncbi:MAG: hypothetical protein K2Q26_03595 [Bdellovibrionales bacterium]|nr:hypothetical protein [Bdellovibrionales bacterium]